MKTRSTQIRHVSSFGWLQSFAAGKGGASLVELLVVSLLVVIVGVGLSAGIGMALSIEQSYREEAEIRTTMALQMDYLERYFSLARSVDGGNATFPLETAGVSWETNHWVRVRNMEMAASDGLLSFDILAADPRRNLQDEDGAWERVQRTMRGDALLRAALARMGEGRVITAALQGAGAVRRLVLEVEFDETVGLGGNRSMQTRTNRMTRPIRLWNYEE